MKFFLDTPNLEQIQEAYDLGIIDGVTTNPSLMAKMGIIGEKNRHEHYIKICNIVDGDVSAPVISTEYNDIIKEGEKLASLHPQIVVKIPVIKDGIKAIKYLSDKGIKTNCTLIFTVGQALLAAKAGASYVSPFIGRLDDISQNGVGLIKQIVDMFNYYEMGTMVLVASTRSTQHISKCIEYGADVVTCPLDPLLGLLKHPLTDSGLKQFLNDHYKAENELSLE